MTLYKPDLTTIHGRFEYNYRYFNRFFINPFPFIISLPFLAVFIFVIFQIQNLWLCQGMNSCRVWGDTLTKSFLLAIFTGPFFAKVVNHFFLAKFGLRGWLSANKPFIFITSLLIPIGLFIFFSVYTKTTPDYLEIGDPYHLGLFNNYKISYGEITGIGATSFGSPTSRWNSCKVLPYITLQNKQIIFLYGALNNYALVEYLHKKLRIPMAIGIGINNRCGLLPAI